MVSRLPLPYLPLFFFSPAYSPFSCLRPMLPIPYAPVRDQSANVDCYSSSFISIPNLIASLVFIVIGMDQAVPRAIGTIGLSLNQREISFYFFDPEVELS